MTAKVDAAAGYSEERDALHRLRWYMLLRWLGVAVLYPAPIAAKEVGHYPFSNTTANVIAPFVLAYNIVVWRLIARWRQRPPARWRLAYRLLGNAQCAADLVVLSIGLHFAGGIESWVPLSSVAVLVVAGIVLPPRDSLAQGLLACALFDFVIIAEATGRLHHAALGFLVPSLPSSARYVASIVILYDTVLLFIVALVVFLSSRLHQRELELAHLYGREHETVEGLRELDRLKSEFLATVSHELRTPLTAIRGFALTLQRTWETADDATRREEVSVIERQSERLNRLVANLLDFSALEAGRASVHVGVVSVRDIVQSAAAAAATPVTIDVPDDLEVLADSSRIEQVIVNLVENAEKYGRPPFTVTARRLPDAIEVAVEDCGPGVPEEKVAGLFSRFFQADSSATRTARGVGLGLALVKGYVEAHAGEVGYRRRPGGGACFWFALPMPAVAPARPVGAAGTGATRLD